MRRALLISLLVVGCTKNDAPTVTAPVVSASAQAEPPPSATASAAPVSDDPIDRLVAKLSASPMWNNGGFARITLPETASTNAVLGEVFAKSSFDEGHVTKYSILKERNVVIGDEPRPYKAVLIETNFGRAVALLQYNGPQRGWWSRVFRKDE